MERCENIKFEYMYQPPKKFTFEQPKLRKWVERNCQGKVLNLFAGKTKLNIDEFRVDSNKDMKADWYGDALEFLKTTDMKFDTIILDPPYSFRKSYEKYQGHYIGSKYTIIKKAVIRVLNDRARVITFGFNSQGMSRRLGFKKIGILLVCHNGDHNDTICLVEAKLDKNLTYFDTQTTKPTKEITK